MPVPTLSQDPSKKKTTTNKPATPVVAPASQPVDSLAFSHATFDNMTKRLKGKKIDISKRDPKAMTASEKAALKHVAPKAADYQAKIDAHRKKIGKDELDDNDLDEATGGKGKEAMSYISAYQKHRSNTTLGEKPVSTKKDYEMEKTYVRNPTKDKPEGTANVYMIKPVTKTTMKKDEGATTLRGSKLLLPSKGKSKTN